ncbi:carbon-nitrogen family hydrolase [Lactococcus nasutitermitis]|uniref:Carbon-nitrogen family hydrolase n=1 Tax=Lactococcus nasutitermitis TaxID=1652957 RepID=A0ABV9JA90_9LACT|nr:carbon-nitrogen family hydrolase [Lactococcus nasutitermitis]
MVKIALAQMDVIFAEPEKNFEKVGEFTKLAAEKKADVVVFPEMWNTGYALSNLTELADSDGKRTKKFLTELSKKYQINIVGGSVATAKSGKFYNSNYIFDTDGNLVSHYDKVHLFGPMDEEKFISSGASENVFELADVKSAAVICYDIRFPEWLCTNMKQGAKILYVVAEWPEQRIEQWKILLQARAIENQAFVVAVNRVGHDLNNRFSGHSLAVGPLGNILLDAGEAESLQLIDIDVNQVDIVRGQIPVFADRRPELYH